MSSQVCIKTDKSLQQLATGIQKLLSLPAFTEISFDGESEPYCQFEMLGTLILIRRADEEEREPEVKNYAYSFDLQLTFTESNLDTDTLEYNLQAYYAQLLSYSLDIETACYEKKKVGQHWQIRYCFYRKNPRWDGSILYGEPGWEPAVITSTPGPWRSVLPMF
ncbi:hypothetical protein EPA93_32400 [Ktedonosporobacter rubrisoli]|uniref:Uncharacterized protein n=1 Tax=Ktedonosporobacter rubrisoli TaxID=2509675 RepID=A0A4P6JY74_KTERU|nr:hypothetical protein [Ktedonosporobacter rubrisoli]QBD80422.1 hypothetical protein EPA93_32400 [Ktedonosporobacter rubrisoli]